MAHLNTESLWIDEVFTLVGARNGLLGGSYVYLSNNFPPLYGWLAYLVSAGGDSLSSARLFSWVAGVGGILVYGWLFTRLSESRSRRLALLLLCFHPLLLWHCLDARPYALLFLWAACFQAALWGGGRRWIFLFGWVGCSTHYYFYFQLLAGFLYLPRARRTLVLAGSAALVWLLLGLWLTRGFDHAGAYGWKGVGYCWLALLAGYTGGPPLEKLHGPEAMQEFLPYAPAAAVVAGLLLVTIAVGWLSSPPTLRRWFLAFVLVPLAAPMTVSLLSKSVPANPRYLIMMLGPLSLLLAQAARRPVGLGLTLACLVVQVHFLSRALWRPEYWKEDYAATAAFLKEQWREDDQILVGTYPAGLRLLLPGTPIEDLKPQHYADFSLGIMPSPRGRLFVVINRPWVQQRNWADWEKLPGFRVARRENGFLVLTR